MTPPQGETPQYDRRRAEDVYRTMEKDIFPRLGAIDSKIDSLEHGVQKLMVEGCAQRSSDMHRVEATEHGIERIFEKIDDFGGLLSDARVAMVAQVGVIKTEMTEQVGAIKLNQERQYGGLKAWIQAGVIVILFGVAGYFARDYLHNIEKHLGGAPEAISTTAPRPSYPRP